MNRPARQHAITDPRVLAIVELFEQFSLADLDRFERFYASNAWFKDPFNEVHGVAAIRAIFRHMFESLQQPRFFIRDVIVQHDQCFISWDFEFRTRRMDKLQTIRGASHLRFDTDGRVESHRDYWDAAEELYEKLPLIGSLMRWLRRRVSS